MREDLGGKPLAIRGDFEKEGFHGRMPTFLDA